MGSDSDNNVEDTGRRESEKRLSKGMGSKYLDEVMRVTGKDYDEVAEMIEREKKMMDSMEVTFIDSLEKTMEEKAQGLQKQEDKISYTFFHYKTRTPTLQNPQEILAKADGLVDDYQHVSKIHNDFSKHPKGNQLYTTTWNKDKAHTKEVLTAGKRVAENDIDGLKQQAEGKEEAVKDGQKLFAIDEQRARAIAKGDVALKYMQKGARKYGKGLDSDV